MPKYDVKIIRQNPYMNIYLDIPFPPHDNSLYYPVSQKEVVFSRTLFNLEEAQAKGHDELCKYEASYILHGETWRWVESQKEWRLGGEIHYASVKLRK